MEHVVRTLEKEKIWWVLAFGACTGMIASAFFLPGGDDLYRYYIPFVNGCPDCGFVPYYAQAFLWPLRFLPEYPYAWTVWTIINILGFMTLAYFTRVNPLLFITSFPMLGQIWLGQVDIVICLGMVLFLIAKNPYARGLGIALALTKPQLMVLPILYSLFLEDRRTFLKMLAVPAVLGVASLFIWGADWPLHWIANALAALPVHVWRLASLDFWRFGIFLLPLPFLVRHRQKRLEAGLLVSALATPFFGVYSYVTFLLLNTRWWSWVLSFAWVLAYFWYRESAMRFAWVLPLSMLSFLIYEVWMERRVTSNKKSISSVSE